jgi:hypothetical protein
MPFRPFGLAACGIWRGAEIPLRPFRALPYCPGCSTVAVRLGIGGTLAFAAVLHLYQVCHVPEVQNASGWRFVSYVQSQGSTLPV